MSFLEGSASNFPGIGSELYDIIFSNHVIHWISDKQQIFKNMFGSLKRGGKITIQYNDRFLSFEMSAYKVLNPENAPRLLEMCQFEETAKIEEYCSTTGFHIVTSYDTSMQLAFESIESLLNWIWSCSHGVFDRSLVTVERLQKYYPRSSRNGKPPFDSRGIKEESSVSRLITVKQTG